MAESRRNVGACCHTAGMTNDVKASRKRFAELCEQQYHVISRRQALEHGFNASKLRHRLRPGGPWQKILPGVYATTTGTVTSDQRQMAALLYAGEGAVLTGACAVRRHHLSCPGGNEVEVLVPVNSRVKGHGYVRVQRTRRMPVNTFSTRAITFAPLPRAVGDAARGILRPGDVQALVCEAVQKGRDCSLEDLIAEVKAGPIAGSALLRAALAEIGEGIRSEAERDLKYRIDRSDLEKPLYNARLYLPDGTFLAMVDAWWQRAGVAVEVDSRQYHMSAKDNSATADRHNKITAVGIKVLHFPPRDIKSRWPGIYATIRDAVGDGTKKPPLGIIAVPANVTDVRAYLLEKLAA